MTFWGPALEPGLGSSHSLSELGYSDVSQWETFHPVSNFSQAAEDSHGCLPSTLRSSYLWPRWAAAFI